MTCADCDKGFDDFEEVVHIEDSFYCKLCAEYIGGELV